MDTLLTITLKLMGNFPRDIVSLILSIDISKFTSQIIWQLVPIYRQLVVIILCGLKIVSTKQTAHRLLLYHYYLTEFTFTSHSLRIWST